MVAALGLEARAVRRRVHGVRVLTGGIALGELRGRVTTPVALSVGLAGGLDRALEPGTVVVPEVVTGPRGERWATDAAWSAALRAASERLSLPTTGGALVTTAAVVTGDDRERWATRGYAAADMESAVIAQLAPAIAVVRVILDTPSHEISPLWLTPARAALRPRLWSQGLWLARTAPRLARRAADVLAEALRGDVDAEV